MTRLHDLMNPTAVAEAIEQGLVRRQVHPTGLLEILNYTEQAVYTRTWTDVTTRCRGLILDVTTGEVVARPFAKFFNHGEHAADTLDLAAAVEVTDKADGSLGILYTHEGEPAIATRGSFASEQARHATALYRSRYHGTWAPAEGWTYLYEIVYPANRIVLDYGDLDDLILLGAVHIATGETVGPAADHCRVWPGPAIEIHPYRTLADAIAAEPRPNAEGLVVRYRDGDLAGTMVKLKQDDYVSLHRIITGLTARRLWERAAVFAVLAAEPDCTVRRLGQVLRMDPVDVQGIVEAGPTWDDEVRKTAPEEFTEWIDATLERLAAQAADVLHAVDVTARELADMERKDAAQRLARHPHRGMVFAALDGKPVTPSAWAAIRPEAEKPYAARSEDVA